MTMLRTTLYPWLEKPENLTARQRAVLRTLKPWDLKTGRASHVKLALRRFWTFRSPKRPESYLTRWSFWATHTRLDPVIEPAKAIKRHRTVLLSFIHSRSLY